jgi:hypothetical protein
LRSAEADLTWTTRKYDLGGNVREAEAQSNGETRFSPPAVCVVFLVLLFRASLIAFLAGGWRFIALLREMNCIEVLQVIVNRNAKRTREDNQAQRKLRIV